MGTKSLKQIYIAGPNTFYDEFLTFLGLKNPYQDKQKYPKLTPEGIINLNPDLVFDLVPNLNASGYTKDDAIDQWKVLSNKVGGIKAIESNQVHIIDKDYAVIPGPRLILLLKELNQLLNQSILLESTQLQENHQEKKHGS